MWNCRMYPASPNSFLCSAPVSNCSYSLPPKCIWFHWTATMLCRTRRGKPGRELSRGKAEGFVAISVGVAQVLRGATELLWMQQRQMESWKCWREHRSPVLRGANAHSFAYFACTYKGRMCCLQHLICSLSTAQDTKEVKWVEYQRCKAWKQNHGDVVMSSPRYSPRDM